VARRIVFVAYPGMQILDLTGPLEVFAMANRLAGRAAPPYFAEVVSPAGGATPSSCGLAILASGALRTCHGPIDTLVVVGGLGTVDAARNQQLVDWIRSAARRSRRVTSVCSGAFLLARAGLLDGKRATTHWSCCRLLARSHPTITVESDRIFVRDGKVWTSAGVTAGIDLALALVEDDVGPAIAHDVARQLVLFVQRSGGQAQFSTQMSAPMPTRVELRHLQAWLADNLTDDLTVAKLAGRVGMSTRNFSRAFRDQLGTTPAAYVESARVEAARRLLVTTGDGIDGIARRCGFGTAATMHRAFRRTIKVTPGEYRRHFRSQASA
jgi:transcriptional regulator GlxA family with amidase domain